MHQNHKHLLSHAQPKFHCSQASPGATGRVVALQKLRSFEGCGGKFRSAADSAEKWLLVLRRCKPRRSSAPAHLRRVFMTLASKNGEYSFRSCYLVTQQSEPAPPSFGGLANVQVPCESEYAALLQLYHESHLSSSNLPVEFDYLGLLNNSC